MSGRSIHEAPAIVCNDVKGANRARSRSEIRRTDGCTNPFATRGHQDDAMLAVDRHDCVTGKGETTNRLQCNQETSTTRPCKSYQEAKWRWEIPTKSLRPNGSNVQSTTGSRAVQAETPSASFGTWLRFAKCPKGHAARGTVSYQLKNSVRSLRNFSLVVLHKSKSASDASRTAANIRRVDLCDLAL